MIFLGIDCGTQSTKTIALDWESGEILASAQKSYGFVPDLPPGAMEQNPNDWIDAAEQSIGEVVERHVDWRPMRPDHESLRRPRKRHCPGREYDPHRLHGSEDPLAASERAGELEKDAEHPASSRLSQFLAHRR